jgi:ankyrin repeat protein
MYAALLNDDPDIVRALIDDGANADAETEAGMTALMWALLAETHDHAGQNMGALKDARRRDAAMEILKNSVNVNAVCRAFRWLNWTPLHFAAMEPDRNASLVSALLTVGANPNAETAEGVTPLMRAAARGDFSSAVHDLLAAGANVDAKSREEGREDWTPLFYALTGPRRSPPVVRELTRHSADVNHVAPNGATPLLLAVCLGDNPALVKLLLDAGAAVRSPLLDRARAKNHRRAARLLEKATIAPKAMGGSV